MKVKILLITTLLAGSLWSVAQERPQQEPMSPGERSKIFVERIAPKLGLSKEQKDSLAAIFMQFVDDIQKYHAENNEKVIRFMMKTRDEKVKVLLRDTVKFEKYLMILEESKKHGPQQGDSTRQFRREGQRHNRGGGMGSGQGENRNF